MSKRYEALGNGEKTYSTGKPCRKGHFSDRYSSNGMCIECLKTQRDTYTNAVARRNLMNSQKMYAFEVSLQIQHKQLADDITDIMLEGGQRADMLAAYIALIGRSALTRADVIRMLVKDDEGIIRNPMRTGDNGMHEVELQGEWYNLGEIREVERGIRDHAMRIQPARTLERTHAHA